MTYQVPGEALPKIVLCQHARGQEQDQREQGNEAHVAKDVLCQRQGAPQDYGHE